jgi:hypothetical protein
MDVGVLEPRQDGPAREVDDGCASPHPGPDLLVRPDRDDPAAADRERLRDGVFAVKSVDTASEQCGFGRCLSTHPNLRRGAVRGCSHIHRGVFPN